MKCQICNINEAQIVFTQIVDNEKIVMKICTECAKKKGLTIEFHTSESHDHPTSHLSELINDTDNLEDEIVPDVACDFCGLSFEEFKKTGLFGCDRCHSAFGDHLKTILTQIHGIDVHHTEPDISVNHRSPVVSLKRQLKKLRDELKHCVETEEYEKAAELRDRISEMQKRTSE